MWQRARKLANSIHNFSEAGTFARDFTLRDQMRRAAVSIMSNIAEGFISRTQVMFIEYLGRAKGSAGELRAQLYLDLDRKYLSQAQFQEMSQMAVVSSKQITKLSQYLESRPIDCRISEDEASYDV